MAEASIDHERLLREIHYDPATGKFERKVKTSAFARLGPLPGTKAGRCYRVTSVQGQQVYLHRLAWFYVHGEWPKQVIDHVNGDPLDNRIANLRDVAQRTNCQNMRTGRGASRLLGVSKSRRRFMANIRLESGERIHLGVFATAEEAFEVYLAKKRELHAGCTI